MTGAMRLGSLHISFIGDTLDLALTDLQQPCRNSGASVAVGGMGNDDNESCDVKPK